MATTMMPDIKQITTDVNILVMKLKISADPLRRRLPNLRDTRMITGPVKLVAQEM
tara:strand:+ start:40 stop:204 length:165 start_codon:yes stop_codon:yes gene_type:complete